MTEEREMTALDAPVGADAEQSLNNYNGIIPDYGEDFNPSGEEMFEAQMQYEQEMQAQAQAEREASPSFMQTVSMPELYEMVYPGKPPIIHDLRHSHVSLLIELGFSAVAIADRVGHESIEITYRYALLFPSKQKEMANRLGELKKGGDFNVSKDS